MLKEVIFQTADRFFSENKKYQTKLKKQSEKLVEFQIKSMVSEDNIKVGTIKSDEANSQIYFTNCPIYVNYLIKAKKGIIYYNEGFIYGLFGDKSLVNEKEFKAFCESFKNKGNKEKEKDKEEKKEDEKKDKDEEKKDKEDEKKEKKDKKGKKDKKEKKEKKEKPEDEKQDKEEDKKKEKEKEKDKDKDKDKKDKEKERVENKFKYAVQEKLNVGKKNVIKDIYQISCFTNFNVKELQEKFKELGFKEIE